MNVLGGRSQLLEMLIRMVPAEEQRARFELDPDIRPGTARVATIAGGQLYWFYYCCTHTIIQPQFAPI